MMKEKSSGSKEVLRKKGNELRKDAISFSLGILLIVAIMILFYIIFER